MTSIIVPDRVGVFAFDPGGTTGVGWTLCKTRGTVRATLKRAKIHTCEITGEWDEQARKLRDLWNAVQYQWTTERQLPQTAQYLVREDFNLYKFRSSEKKGVYPIWISAMFMGLIDDTGVRVYAQTPLEAKRFATNERLKRWGVYVPGSEHKRDVTRHIAERLNRIL